MAAGSSAFGSAELKYPDEKQNGRLSPFLECCFPYVCPEPVLAKCSFVYINGSKRPFLLTCPPHPAIPSPKGMDQVPDRCLESLSG